MSGPAGEKLHKVLAQAGLGSRREMERWIADGRISVNGKRATTGLRVGPEDVVRVDGRQIQTSTTKRVKTRVLCYHKPAGQVCTRSDPEGRPTVFDGLPRMHTGRWIAVGRLDISTSGLLLFTNDGELANRLMHPSSEIEREYAVRVRREVSTGVLRNLKEGVELEDGAAHFDSVIDAGGSGGNHWYHVVVKEGRNREVRRLWESQGVEVSRLIRIRFGSVELSRSVRAGRFAELEASDTRQLESLGGKSPAPKRPQKKKTPRSRRS